MYATLYWRRDLEYSSGLMGFSAILSTRPRSTLSSLQHAKVDNCTILRKQHVSVLVKRWTWIPETLNNLYSCECGLTCLWTNSDVLVEKPDALLYETDFPPSRVSAAQNSWCET
jgi:alpha-1,4-fucosyltransferase